MTQNWTEVQYDMDCGGIFGRKCFFDRKAVAVGHLAEDGCGVQHEYLADQTTTYG
jgi:hypothetical protein